MPKPTIRPLRRACRHAVIRLVCAFCAIGTSGCATQGNGPLDKALEVFGLKRAAAPELPATAAAPSSRRMPLRLHAGAVLNTDAAGRSLALVARVYKLRASTGFLQAPYAAFAEPEHAQAWSREVIEVREVVLAPGQQHEVVETLPPEASHIAVVALFRAPAEQRWRFVFDARAAGPAGITVGLHGCAMSVAEGPVVDSAPENQRLAGVHCR